MGVLVAYSVLFADKNQVIDNARTVCGAGSLKRSSVCLSVRLSYRSAAATAISGFAAECITGRRCRSIAATSTPQQRHLPC